MSVIEHGIISFLISFHFSYEYLSLNIRNGPLIEFRLHKRYLTNSILT